MPQTRRHEFLRVETHRFTWTTCSIGKLIQEGKGGVISDEDAEPPPTGRVTFHTVEEVAAAVPDQFLAKLVAASVCSPTIRLSRPYACPPISRWLVAALRSRNMKGAEVCQRGGGKGGEVGHLTVFSRVATKPCFKCMDCGLLHRLGDRGCVREATAFLAA
jgi:hypothetical protein